MYNKEKNTINSCYERLYIFYCKFLSVIIIATPLQFQYVHGCTWVLLVKFLGNSVICLHFSEQISILQLGENQSKPKKSELTQLVIVAILHHK